MLYLLSIRFLLFIGISGALSISHTDAKATDRISTPVQTHNAIETYIDIAQKQLATISSILSDISFLMHENQFQFNENQELVLQNIQELIQDIENKKNILKITTDRQIIGYITSYIHTVIGQLEAILKHDVSKLSQFDPHTYMTRAINTTQSSDQELENQFYRNNDLLILLERNTHSIGLRWYNKTYRIFNKYILEYAHEYATLSLGILLGAGYITWHLFPDSFEDTWIGRPFSPNPYSTVHGSKLESEGIKIPGSIEKFLASSVLNLLPIGSLISFLIKDQVSTRWKTKTEPWLRKHFTTFHYKMLGGAYSGKIAKLDGIGKKIFFDDLIGLDHAKHECQYIINYMKDPETYIRRGQKINHILFTGPPRTGKTELAKALYYEVKNLHSEQVKFIPLPAASINVIGIDRCLDIIKYHAPCIVFIDEIDLLNVQRSGKNEVLSALLQGMSGLDNDNDPTKQVIIIGATNKPEYLDFALMTHGRFGKVIHFEYPNLSERTLFLSRQLKKLGLDVSQFNIKKLAQESEGKSYESLKTTIDHATLKARLCGKSLAYYHLEAALDEELNKIVPTDLKDLPEHEQEILAAHFAGHALAWHILNPHTKLAKITIKPVIAKLKEELIGKELWQGAMGKKNYHSKEQARYIYGHTFIYHDQDTCNLYDEIERIKLCKIYLAGVAAEKIIIGNSGYSCDCHDNEYALEIIRPLIFAGFDSETLPKKIVSEKYQQALQSLAQYEQEITTLLLNHKDALINIAIELKEAKILSSQIIQEIVSDTES